MRFHDYMTKSKKVQRPGSRGGHPWWDGAEWRYDEQPGHLLAHDTSDQGMATASTFESLYHSVFTKARLGQPVYVRWSRGPAVDAISRHLSTDHLTGEKEVGLSASPLTRNGRALPRKQLAEALLEYSHVAMDPEEGGYAGTRCWLLFGDVVGEDSDGEALLTNVKPYRWVSKQALEEALHWFLYE